MSLNVIGLISGGKDSLYSLAHCIQNGHKVIALANLYPSAGKGSMQPTDGTVDEGEDINSFMYQTVGHSIIPFYSHALGLPLFRQEIRGSAIQIGRYYDTSNVETLPDEIEDLMMLVQKVMTHHPEANALCSGAILSTYQRTRVESVALRLGLTPLSYLWQYPALPAPFGREDSLTGLLDDMEIAGCDARIIKIASGGIKESLLWSNVTQSTTKTGIVTGMAPFFQGQEFWLRGAVLGEGGEYETLSLNGPSCLWEKRIEVQQAGFLTGEGGASYVQFSGAKLCDREDQTVDEHVIPIPLMLDQQFVSILSEPYAAELKTMTQVSTDDLETTGIKKLDSLPVSINLTSTHLTINNITSFHVPSPVHSTEPAFQLEAIVTQLPSIISSVSSDLTTSSVIFSTLLLHSMSDFANINPIYSRIWPAGRPNPPSRVTVAVPLPPDVHVALSIVLSLGPTESRRGLHVQSRSYWAPANIGPYSQAIPVPLSLHKDPGSSNIQNAEIPEAVHVAGQIPLVPASMEILQAPFPEQAVLALQHLWRVGQERSVDTWTWGVAYLEGPKPDSLTRAITSMRIWQAVYETPTHNIKHPKSNGSGEDSDSGTESTVDIWDLLQNRSKGFGFGDYKSAAAVTVGQHLHILPNSTISGSSTNEHAFTPPFIAAEVGSLPRSAPIEWWSMGLSGLVPGPDSINNSDAKQLTRGFGLGDQSWGSVAGITLTFHNSPKTRNSDENSESFSKSEPSGRLTRTTFATILLNMKYLKMMKEIPETPSELFELLQSKEPKAFDDQLSGTTTIHEVVHSTAFLNMSGVLKSVTSTELLKTSLFESASIIPCYRVWACWDWNRKRSTEERDEFGSKIIEVAATFVLRIDSRTA